MSRKPARKTAASAAPIASLTEARRIHDLINRVARPKGIQGFELRFGEDATGDPAVWVYFILDPDYPTSPPGIRALTDLSLSVSETILTDAGSKRIPYVNFKDLPTKAA